MTSRTRRPVSSHNMELFTWSLTPHIPDLSSAASQSVNSPPVFPYHSHVYIVPYQHVYKYSTFLCYYRFQERGWQRCLLVKNTFSCRPGFGSLHPHGCLQCLYLQLQGIQRCLLAFKSIRHACSILHTEKLICIKYKSINL